MDKQVFYVLIVYLLLTRCGFAYTISRVILLLETIYFDCLLFVSHIINFFVIKINIIVSILHNVNISIWLILSISQHIFQQGYICSGPVTR